MEMSLLKLQNDLRNMGMLISFSGRFSQGIIEELGDAIKKHLEAEYTPKNEIFNVFAIFIEQTQNIKNYSVKKSGSSFHEKISSSGIISIGKLDAGYFIWSGNLIENTDAEALSEKLDFLAKQSKDELKRLYKEQLRKELPEDSLGAGVGLIEIARKSSRPLEYSIVKQDDNFSFFELRVVV